MDNYGGSLRGYDSADDVLVAIDASKLRRIIAADSAPDIQPLGAEGGRVNTSPRLGGRDLYLRRLERAMDGELGELDEDEEREGSEEEAAGRELSVCDLYVQRLSRL